MGGRHWAVAKDARDVRSDRIAVPLSTVALSISNLCRRCLSPACPAYLSIYLYICLSMYLTQIIIHRSIYLSYHYPILWHPILSSPILSILLTIIDPIYPF